MLSRGTTTEPEEQTEHLRIRDLMGEPAQGAPQPATAPPPVAADLPAIIEKQRADGWPYAQEAVAEQARAQIVAAIEARKRRADRVIGMAGAGLVVLIGMFGALLGLRSAGTEPSPAGSEQVASQGPAPTLGESGALGSSRRQTHVQLRLPMSTVGQSGAMVFLRGLPDGVVVPGAFSPTPGTWVAALDTTRPLVMETAPEFLGDLQLSLDVIGEGGVALAHHTGQLRLPASQPELVLTPAAEAVAAAAPIRGLPRPESLPTSDVVQAPVVARPAVAPAPPSEESSGQAIALDARPETPRTATQPAYGLGGPR